VVDGLVRQHATRKGYGLAVCRPLLVPRDHRAAVGLAEYARATGNQAAREAAERAAELLLAHRLFRSHRTGRVAHAEWLQPHSPHTGTTTSSSSCSSWPLRQGRGPRAAEALDLVAAKRDADGRWRPGGRRYWCPPGSQGSNVEVGDWGRSGPNELLTLSALRVLRAAGRPPA
jgi:hypothetical protein